MNEIFAIEPEAFNDHRDLKLLLGQFGFSEGRFIAKFPGRWRKLVIEHLQNLPDVERSRAVSILQKHGSDSIISMNHDYQPKSSWLENAIFLKNNEKVSDLIVSRNNAGPHPSIDEVDKEYFYRWGGRQADIMSSANGYAEAAKILLQESSEVAIFDPYYRELNSRYKKVFDQFVNVALGGKCRHIKVLTMEDEKSTSTPEQMRRACNQFFLNAQGNGISVTFQLLRDTAVSEADNHGRFLVSLKGAMQFDKGFDEEKTPRLRKVAYLDAPMSNKLYQQFFEDKLPFHIIQSISF